VCMGGINKIRKRKGRESQVEVWSRYGYRNVLAASLALSMYVFMRLRWWFRGGLESACAPGVLKSVMGWTCVTGEWFATINEEAIELQAWYHMQREYWAIEHLKTEAGLVVRLLAGACISNIIEAKDLFHSRMDRPCK